MRDYPSRPFQSVATGPKPIEASCTNALAAFPAADRILVIRLGAVGDVVRTLPAVAMLRRAAPDAHITWLVESASQSAVLGQPWVDEVVVFPRAELRRALGRFRFLSVARTLQAVAASLRRPGFDLVLDFHAILKSGALSWLSGAAMRVTYAKPFSREGAAFFATHRAELSTTHTSRFLRNEALVRFLGVSGRAPERPFLVTEADRSWARDALPQRADGAPLVVLHPGTSAHTSHKRWPIERYATVARSLRGTCLVSYGPDSAERSAAQALVSAAKGAAQLAPATRSLGQLAALLEAASLYVGGDTGPLHVASLVGTPVVQLMGPTDPVENEPFVGTPHRRIRVPLACSPCRRGCDAAPCMQRIRVDAVCEAAESLLRAHPH